MEVAMKSSSSGASMDGTATMDVNGVTFLMRQLEGVNVMKTTNYGSSFALEIGYYGRKWVGWSGMEMWMVAECGME